MGDHLRQISSKTGRGTRTACARCAAPTIPSEPSSVQRRPLALRAMPTKPMPPNGTEERKEAEERKEWRPDDPCTYAPIFAPEKWSASNIAAYFLGYPGFFAPWNLLYVAVCVASHVLTTPALEECAQFEFGWVNRLFWRNQALLWLLAGGWHVLLYGLRVDGMDKKYDRKWPGADAKFLFGHQTYENMFMSCVSGACVAVVRGAPGVGSGGRNGGGFEAAALCGPGASGLRWRWWRGGAWGRAQRGMAVGPQDGVRGSRIRVWWWCGDACRWCCPRSVCSVCGPAGARGRRSVKWCCVGSTCAGVVLSV